MKASAAAERGWAIRLAAGALPALAALALAAAVVPRAEAQDDRKKQEIQFDELPARSVGDAPFALAAKASSGLPVSFQIVSGPAVLDGKKVRLTDAPGLVIVRATQGGNGAFLPARPAERAFAVNPRPSPPKFLSQPAGASAEIGGMVVLSAEATGEPKPGFQWRKDGAPLNGATDRTLTIAAAMLSDAGIYDVVASNASGTAASGRARVIVTKRHQTITFQGPTTAVAGQPVTLNASASSGLQVQYAVIGGVATLTGPVMTAQPGMVFIQATQAGDSSYEAADPAVQTFTINAPMR
ncbi:MAG: immunoglobulin domain-containing protein [Opitutaceae bacterium]|jgi:hypothetical protein